MQRILDDPELLAEFEEDRLSHSQNQLAEMYGISQSTVNRLIKRLNALQANNNSEIEEKPEQDE